MAEVSAHRLRERIASGDAPDGTYTLLDVREPSEIAQGAIDGSLRIPLGEVVARLGELDASRETIVHYGGGTRSSRAIEALRGAGYEGRLVTLVGGMRAWNASA